VSSLARLPSYAARIISLVLFFLILSLAILVSLAWLGRRSLGLLRRLIGRLGLGERPLSASALRVGEGIACAFEAIPSSRTYLVVSLLSLLAWLGTFAWFACFLASMGVRTGLSQTIVGATFAVLSKALPFVTVGGLGTHEAGWTVGFMLVGFDKETAIATGFAVNILTTTLSVHQQTGGDLVCVLERLAQTIRDRLLYLGRLRTATIGSRATATLMLLLPIGIVAFFVFRDPNYLTELLATPWGKRLTLTAIALQLIGSAWIWRIFRNSQRA